MYGRLHSEQIKRFDRSATPFAARAPDEAVPLTKAEVLRCSFCFVDGGGKRGQNSGGLVTFHSAPFPLGRGVLSERPAAVKGARRCCAAKRTPSRRGPSVLRSSTRGKGVALNGPLKWPSRSPPLTSPIPSV